MKSHLTDSEFQHHVSFDSQLFPFKFYQTYVQNGIPDVLFHWHPEMEINFVRKGRARYHIDYDFFESQAGDIILIRPNAMHSIHPIEQDEHLVDTFQFHLDLIGNAARDYISISYLQPLQNNNSKFITRIRKTDPGYQDLADCLNQIFQLTQEPGRHFELLLKAKLTEFLYLVYFHKLVKRKNTDDLYRKNEKIRDIIDHIQEHYAEDLTIESLAERMGYSKTHFMTVFKQHTGSTATEFIIQIRLQKASHELVQSMKPILEIATEVGFNNLSNFNRQFKLYYQMTPSQYRKTFRNSSKHQ
ncbi:helix-turn-helix domain-containing protein [Streptococcus caprae]|uniref:Helix-turn-helix domain-containing protein n=1 Tax=Streptococcus caprae TaxID=1640501 RepID=A0ABV8CVL5_9STRE